MDRFRVRRPMGAYNAVAEFPDMARARQAMDALQRAGIEASKVSIEGRAVERAASHTHTSDRDARVAEHVGSRTGLGALIGLAVGAAVGLIAGTLVLDLSTGGIVAATISTAVAGGAVGGVLGGVTSADLAEEWELTHDPDAPGPVLVVVHSDDPEEINHAAGVLRDKGPVHIERLDSEGHRLAG